MSIYIGSLDSVLEARFQDEEIFHEKKEILGYWRTNKGCFMAELGERQRVLTDL
jgi:hypothetical protein